MDAPTIFRLIIDRPIFDIHCQFINICALLLLLFNYIAVITFDLYLRLTKRDLSIKAIDHLDAAIIDALEADARTSLAEIGKRIGISGPAVGERLRRLREDGPIEGFGPRLNLRALGYSLEALVRIKPRSGELKKAESLVKEEPRFLWCDRVTGEDCLVAKLALLDVAELDSILMALHDHAETHTSIVKSSVITHRQPPLIPERATSAG